MQYRFWRDPATYTLVAANAYTLAGIINGQLSLMSVLWLYWLQSIIIGVATIMRLIRAPVPQPNIGKYIMAGFFTVHYGIFHFGYMVFLGAISLMLHSNSSAASLMGRLFIPALLFGIHHIWSAILTSRRTGATDLKQIMMSPYPRIIPMHLTIIAGTGLAIVDGPQAAGAIAVIFVGLKSVIDLIMHDRAHRNK